MRGFSGESQERRENACQGSLGDTQTKLKRVKQARTLGRKQGTAVHCTLYPWPLSGRKPLAPDTPIGRRRRGTTGTRQDPWAFGSMAWSWPGKERKKVREGPGSPVLALLQRGAGSWQGRRHEVLGTGRILLDTPRAKVFSTCMIPSAPAQWEITGSISQVQWSRCRADSFALLCWPDPARRLWASRQRCRVICAACLYL